MEGMAQGGWPRHGRQQAPPDAAAPAASGASARTRSRNAAAPGVVGAAPAEYLRPATPVGSWNTPVGFVRARAAEVDAAEVAARG
eukprot:gene37277-61767_t